MGRKPKFELEFQKMPLVFLKWKKLHTTARLHGPKRSLKKMLPIILMLFISYWKWKRKSLVLSERERHITNVAVLHDYRFLNVATLLLKAIEKIARALDKKEITLEARVSNTKAIRLYRKNGYSVVGTKENYYTPENEDAVEMLYTLPPKTPSSFHSSEYSFTRLQPADLAMAEALVELVQENYEHPNHWSAESFLADLENPANTYYGVWMQRQLVGFLGVQAVLDEATITNIVIAKDYQGKGLAQRLWQMALYDLKQKDIQVVFLEVRQSNKRAQYLYEILGFEAFHTRREYYSDPVEDAIEYRLEIEQR